MPTTDLILKLWITLCVAGLTSSPASGLAQESSSQKNVRETLSGNWALVMPDGAAGWFTVSFDDAKPRGQLWTVGHPSGISDVSLKGEQLTFSRRCGIGKPDYPGGPPTGAKVMCRHRATAEGDRIRLVMERPRDDGGHDDLVFHGQRLPPLPPKPDLSKVVFGPPIELFNGRNLDGWKLTNEKQTNGWKAVDGVLVNTTPKKSFDPYSPYGNLRTVAEFEDFNLQLEFKVPPGGNSGVYLRGMYEAQVVDRDSRMQGIQGVGAIFGRIPPSEKAGKPGNEWQQYDITLVDRHITVVLNGVKVIDNQPLEGCTKGALSADETKPGPLYLQGDHTAVSYRNLVLRPVLKKSVEELPETKQLPELMKMNDGRPVNSIAQWRERREELKSALLHYQYGFMPGRPDRVTAIDVERREHDSGKGVVESMTLLIESASQPNPLRMRILVFVPHGAKEKGPLPVVIREEGTLNGNSFVPTFFDHDYIFIEYARHDLDPDRKDTVGSAQQAYPQFDWATLSVWAWGGMRVVDYLETRTDVDMKRICVTGHSRGGKMALLTGALDDRIALAVPVQSGAGGAGCYTMIGPGGESLAMNDKPHWYAQRIQQFIGHADRLPFDQHFVKALMAPRALLCIESVDDDYANPVGSQLTTIAAQPAFDLYGEAAEGRNGIAYRNGSHSFGTDDWQTLLDFAEWHFRGRTPQDRDRFAARPFDLPSGWYATDKANLSKGVGSERVVVRELAPAGSVGFATIGDPGNEQGEDYFGMGRFGHVGYEFEMGAGQVTNSEYTEFLNAVTIPEGINVTTYDADMAIRQRQQDGRLIYFVPHEQQSAAVTNVSWFDAIRYCNWLHNGKPNGPMGPATTESGVYSIDRDEAGRVRVGSRAANAGFAIPNDNEWYKAAYYDGNAYRLYESTEQGGLRVVRHPIDAKSHYGVAGLYDRLWEWNEDRVNGLFRSIRSGAWFVGNNRQAAGRLYSNPELRLPNVGFRVIRL